MKVLNARHVGMKVEGAVYVGRPSMWGNRFSHLAGTQADVRVDTRDEAVERYAEWVVTQRHLMARLPELKGKDLICWCAPARCHADVLLELANKEN